MSYHYQGFSPPLYFFSHQQCQGNASSSYSHVIPQDGDGDLSPRLQHGGYHAAPQQHQQGPFQHHQQQSLSTCRQPVKRKSTREAIREASGGCAPERDRLMHEMAADNVKRCRISTTPGEIRLQKDFNDLRNLQLQHLIVEYTDDPSNLNIEFKVESDVRCPNRFSITVKKFYPHDTPEIVCLDTGFSCPFISPSGLLRHKALSEDWSALGSLLTIVDAVQGIREIFLRQSMPRVGDMDDGSDRQEASSFHQAFFAPYYHLLPADALIQPLPKRHHLRGGALKLARSKTSALSMGMSVETGGDSGLGADDDSKVDIGIETETESGEGEGEEFFYEMDGVSADAQNQIAHAQQQSEQSQGEEMMYEGSHSQGSMENAQYPPYQLQHHHPQQQQQQFHHGYGPGPGGGHIEGFPGGIPAFGDFVAGMEAPDELERQANGQRHGQGQEEEEDDAMRA